MSDEWETWSLKDEQETGLYKCKTCGHFYEEGQKVRHCEELCRSRELYQTGKSLMIKRLEDEIKQFPRVLCQLVISYFDAIWIAPLTAQVWWCSTKESFDFQRIATRGYSTLYVKWSCEFILQSGMIIDEDHMIFYCGCDVCSVYSPSVSVDQDTFHKRESDRSYVEIPVSHLRALYN
jgi:DNA-directed RNA polymerase subunit RPC12/RpoP